MDAMQMKIPVEYFNATRQARYSLTFALPLLLLYEGLAALLSQSAIAGVRNGADVLMKTLFVSLGGRSGLLLFGIALLTWGAVMVIRDWKKHPGALNPSFIGFMVLESLVYAALFGAIVSNLTSMLLTGSLAVVSQGSFETMSQGTQLVVSLGAGLYEELLFRVLLVSGLILVLGKMGMAPKPKIAAAILLSALIFSAFHYIGPYGDQLELGSFTFRAIAGVLLSGLYVARGFGIAAWTHALYDIGLSLTW
jgi:hypothetical protein